jgi:hypothetical protein
VHGSIFSYKLGEVSLHGDWRSCSGTESQEEELKWIEQEAIENCHIQEI